MSVCLYSCLSYTACKLQLFFVDYTDMVARLDFPHFSKLSQERYDFRKNVIEHNFFFRSSLQLLSEELRNMS
jgi:hypothetical protein